MTDQVLLSSSPKNIEACVTLAKRYGLGIEMMAFAYPDLLDGDWRSVLERYKTLLADLPLTMHGPFMDMASGSPDRQINEVCKARFRHAIRIGHEMKVQVVVLHANFIASIHTDEYRSGWQKRNIDFWGQIADYACQLDVTVAIENMWEFDPYIIGDVIKAIDHPNLRACIDIGHAHLYSDVPFNQWLQVMEPYLIHLHINNNDGVMDFHHGLSDGVLDYRRLLAQVHTLARQPSITLEMDNVEAMELSLSFFQLEEQHNPAVSD